MRIKMILPGYMQPEENCVCDVDKPPACIAVHVHRHRNRLTQKA